MASLFIWTSWLTSASLARHASALAAERRASPPIAGSRRAWRSRRIAGWRQVLQRLHAAPVGGLDLADPVALVGVQGAGQAEEAASPRRSARSATRHVERIADVIAEFVADLAASSHICRSAACRPSRRTRAVRAGHRAEFDQLHLGVRIAHQEAAVGGRGDDCASSRRPWAAGTGLTAADAGCRSCRRSFRHCRRHWREGPRRRAGR